MLLAPRRHAEGRRPRQLYKGPAIPSGCRLLLLFPLEYILVSLREIKVTKGSFLSGVGEVGTNDREREDCAARKRLKGKIQYSLILPRPVGNPAS